MPEGDTVWRTAHHLSEVLAGAVITDFDIRVPGSATADLTGETVREVVPRGKHILHRIGEHTLHSHLKMEGAWHIYRPGARWRAPAFRARAVVATSQWQTVGFDLAMVEVLPTREEHRVVGHLGPDPLADDWDAAEAARRLAADDRAVHVALLDQRLVAGFGNEYANEMLFVRGIHPNTPAARLDALAIVELGARMMRQNLAGPGRTFTGDARPGRATWVYGREHRPCRRCGTKIRSGSLGSDATRERNVFWCPRCQPRQA
ncbi:Fpg/Nei family DNA glycosylase [Microbacterium sp. LRZ72]|uniref:DNA-formamidopyrimidine glycosylase family protein n=1 Tax=Microbacterium sp. LRZ72 TaxID=2942481 RepID=UPI0029A29541|nr:DNA-formamidopyrimidine glycosylase family protein [Microbacterium sp. LRZ72]MDX2376678.1 Fpg/Nei family DNA glycosylase [Microbacterium sp. LRZ72]